MNQRALEKMLKTNGFIRSDDRTDDKSLQRFLDGIFGGDEEFFHYAMPEVYIAPALLFGVKDKKYVTFVRYDDRRENIHCCRTYISLWHVFYSCVFFFFSVFSKRLFYG